MSMTIQAGEFKVLHSLMETSIPYLTGWTTMLDINMDAAINAAQSPMEETNPFPF